MNIRILPLLCLLAFASLLIACERANFSAVSSPAPGTTAWLDDNDREIQLTAYAALGIECSNNKGPCRNVQVRVADGERVQVYPAAVSRLVATYTDGRYAGEQPASVWIVVGLQPGLTSIHFDTNDGAASFEVKILDPL